jgi:hypothetical protein
LVTAERYAITALRTQRGVAATLVIPMRPVSRASHPVVRQRSVDIGFAYLDLVSLSAMRTLDVQLGEPNFREREGVCVDARRDRFAGRGTICGQIAHVWTFIGGGGPGRGCNDRPGFPFDRALPNGGPDRVRRDANASIKRFVPLSEVRLKPGMNKGPGMNKKDRARWLSRLSAGVSASTMPPQRAASRSGHRNFGDMSRRSPPKFLAGQCPRIGIVAPCPPGPGAFLGIKSDAETRVSA